MAGERYGRLMLDLEGVSITPDEKKLLLNPHVGGVILFSRNIESRQQITELVSEVRSIVPELLIAVDQEGGRVQRFRKGFTLLPCMQKLGDHFKKDNSAGLALARECGWLMASEVLACGLDISFAPVLDVDRDTSSIIGDRAFSDCPQTVVDIGRAFIEGMNEAGMAATGKHFPGHGGIVADSHLEMPVDNRHKQALEERDLIPFSELVSCLGGVMPAHITFPNIDVKSVGFSPYWLRQILRNELGFEGVIFSDDLSMKGADCAGEYVDKAKEALEAGCDMILVCNNRAGALQVLEYMEATSIERSERIGLMRASKHVEWQGLKSSVRRTQIIQTLTQFSN